MKFPLSFTWSYDPFGMISKLRVEQKTSPYDHTQKPKIEKYMNQVEWEENTLQEAKEQLLQLIHRLPHLRKNLKNSKGRRLSFSHRYFNQRIQDL